MKTIQERAKECSEGYDDDGYSAGLYIGYCEGAYDQIAIDEEVRLKKCADMTPKECEREMAFVNWYYNNGKGTPTFSDAIEWARKELLDKACEWIDKYLHLFVLKDHILYPKLTQEFRKAMEV